jgi:hypothetical protein
MAIVSGTGMVGLVDQMVELAQGPFRLQPARVMQGVENSANGLLRFCRRLGELSWKTVWEVVGEAI